VSKMVNFFCLCVIFFFSSVFALYDAMDLGKYRLYVTKVDPDLQCFEVSNNLVFSIPQKNWEKDQLPEVGTKVAILPKLRHLDNRLSLSDEGEFYVQYSKKSKDYQIAVWITEKSQQEFVTYVSSETVCTLPGWIYGCWVRENVIELSDGSKWSLKKKCTCSKEATFGFNPGDRLIVTQQDENSCMLVDIDESVFYGGKATAIYKWEVVKPYIAETTTKE
jgi:hypothetical protein